MTTLTKKMAERLTDYMREAGVRVRYLHSRGGQAKPIVYKRIFSGTVALIHPAYLRYGNVRFVRNHQEIIRKEVHPNMLCAWNFLAMR